MAGGVSCQIDVHSVTHSSPSESVSFTHALPHEAEISRFSGSPASLGGHSGALINRPAEHNSLKDVHIVRTAQLLLFTFLGTEI